MLKYKGKEFPAKKASTLTLNEQVVKFLKEAPDDEVFDTEQLAEKAKVDWSSLRQSWFYQDPRLIPFKYKTPRGYFWGSEKAIKELRGEL